jgi:hypothetical protein
MIRRDKTGDAEVHTEMIDTIVIEHGTGQFRVGGTIKGNHETLKASLAAPSPWEEGTHD